MSGRHTWNTLRDEVMADPERRARVEEYQRAMQSVQRLAQLREARGATQQQIADALSQSQANISRIEHENDVYVSTVAGYVQALGGRLDLVAVFPDETITLTELSGA